MSESWPISTSRWPIWDDEGDDLPKFLRSLADEIEANLTISKEVVDGGPGYSALLVDPLPAASFAAGCAPFPVLSRCPPPTSTAS